MRSTASSRSPSATPAVRACRSASARMCQTCQVARRDCTTPSARADISATNVSLICGAESCVPRVAVAIMPRQGGRVAEHADGLPAPRGALFGEAARFVLARTGSPGWPAGPRRSPRSRSAGGCDRPGTARRARPGGRRSRPVARTRTRSAPPRRRRSRGSAAWLCPGPAARRTWSRPGASICASRRVLYRSDRLTFAL